MLWRLYRKKGQAGYQTRPQAAAALARKLAEANPERTFWLVGDSAYINAAVLQGPAGEPPGDRAVALEGGAVRAARPASPEQKGASRKKGDRLPNPKAMIEDTATYPAELADDRLPEAGRGSCGCR